MSKDEFVSSYDENAPRPEIGSRWVWEIDSPSARSLIEVHDVIWNGEEWWVWTKTLLPHEQPEGSTQERLLSNDLSRFWEAVTPVGEASNQESKP